MNFKDNKDKFLPYYSIVRDSIRGFDTLIVDILTKGATATVALLVGPLAIFKPEENDDWSTVFFVSIFAVLAALYILTAVALYSDLLRRAVEVGKKLERDIFEGDESFFLTAALDKNPLAGGKSGRNFYLFMMVVLYLGVTAGCTYYLWRWIKTAYALFICPTVLLFLLLLLGIYLQHHSVIPKLRRTRRR